MRVQVIRGRQNRIEHGAIALLSALLAVVVIGFAAFAIDFGMAYNSKRQLQTAADAGAFAAGAYYTDKFGDCAALTTGVTGATYKTASKAIADSYVSKNRPNAHIIDYQVGCNGTNQPTVDVTVDGSTPVGLGKIFSGSSSITTKRSAQVTIKVPLTVKGLRPYVLCSTFVPPANAAFPSGITKVDFPGTEDLTGSCPHAAGNWFTLDCPHIGNSNNGNPDLASATANGCDQNHPISIVDPQNTATPATLYSSLMAGCPSTSNFADYDPDCLSSNPGNISANSVITAWDTLIAKHQPIVFPVFCGQPTCSPAAWSPGAAGNNTLYPVHRLATAQVCGYHWGNKDSGAYVSTGPTDLCNTADATSGTNADNYLLLAFTHVQVSGVLDASACAPGDPTCDNGQRVVRLTK